MKTNPLKLSEEKEQQLFVEYLEILKTQGKIILFTAFPQNANNVQFAMRNKRLGVRAGFPDLFILTKKKAICIEMKVKPNRISFEQMKWNKALNDVGIISVVAYGYEEAKGFIDNETKT